MASLAWALVAFWKTASVWEGSEGLEVLSLQSLVYVLSFPQFQQKFLAELNLFQW